MIRAFVFIGSVIVFMLAAILVFGFFFTMMQEHNSDRQAKRCIELVKAGIEVGKECEFDYGD